MLVKICGVSNAIDAQRAIASGADAIGFVMGGSVLPFEVESHAQTVREFIKTFPPDVDSFLVTHLTTADEILALAAYVGVSGIQISEDIPLEELKKVRAGTTRKIIKTVVVKEGAEAGLAAVEPYCDYLLLDTRVGGYTGGTGVTNDWRRCKLLVAIAHKPVFLAGGLTPENVEDALHLVRPAGADVSTGVSTYSLAYPRKDRKDHEKIRQFIERAKSVRT